ARISQQERIKAEQERIKDKKENRVGIVIKFWNMPRDGVQIM
ncbi:MAG: hypothetical protein EZS28_048434, partial [Streblomastix strix]